MAREIGVSRANAAVPARANTNIASSVAYATEDNGSEAKTGRAKRLGRSWASSSSEANGLPKSLRLRSTSARTLTSYRPTGLRSTRRQSPFGVP